MGHRREVAVFVGLLVVIGVSYMLHRMHVMALNAWDDSVAWVCAHQFWAGFGAGVAASVAVMIARVFL